jgi:hypothetical protein
MTHALYDTIGKRYTSTRRADPRIAATIVAALGDARVGDQRRGRGRRLRACRSAGSSQSNHRGT